MSPLPDPRRERFAWNLARGLNRTDAYEQAGWRRDDGNASRMASSRRIQARVQELIVETIDRPALRGPEGQRRAGTTQATTGQVYVVSCGREFVKIGFSRDVGDRIATLQAHNPFPIQLIVAMDGTPTDEKRLHQRFTAYRTRGEWFLRQGDLAAWLNEIQPNTGGAARDVRHEHEPHQPHSPPALSL